jgi:hypothetical protein
VAVTRVRAEVDAGGAEAEAGGLAGSRVRATGRGWARTAEVALVTLLIAGLVSLALIAVPGRRVHMDASDETFGREWLDATLAALEPGAAILSWWSFSTPLWYGRWVEGRRDDILIVDDRDVLDDGYGRLENAIDHLIEQRPVYIVRLARDLPAIAERYELQQVETVPSPGDLYRVLGRRQ